MKYTYVEWLNNCRDIKYSIDYWGKGHFYFVEKSEYSSEVIVDQLYEMLSTHNCLTDEQREYFDYAKLGWLLTQYPTVTINYQSQYDAPPKLTVKDSYE